MTSMESKNAVLIFGLGNVGGPEHHQPTRVEMCPFARWCSSARARLVANDCQFLQWKLSGHVLNLKASFLARKS